MDETWAPARLAWASGRLAMESPLVNNYKKPFILRRLLETFLGGLRLFAAEDVPLYVYIVQMILYLVIPFLSILFVILENIGSSKLNWAVYTCALLEFVFAFLLQIIAHLLRSQKTKGEQVEQVNFASDEEVLQFDSLFGPKTWSFLIREKRAKINILLHSVIVGVVGGLSIYYIRPVTTVHLNVPWAASMTFSILGLVTVSVGLWPLIGGPPPEPATFHPLPWDLLALSRPLHMIICIGVHFLSSYLPNEAWLLMLDAFFHLLFASSSVLWVLGVLPPIDALILWILEQWVVIILGGSPTASNGRLIAQALFGTIVLFMVSVMPSFEALMVLSSVFGYLLSVDIAWMISSLLSHRVKMLTGISGKYEETQPVEGRPSLRRVTCRRELVLYVSLFVAIVGMSLGCQIPHIGWYKEALQFTQINTGNLSSDNSSELIISNITTDAYGELKNLPLLFQVSARNAAGCLILFLTISILLINELQKVYIFGWLKNPLFVHHKAMQKSNMLYSISQLIQIGGPVVSLLFLHQVVSSRIHQQLAAPFQSFGYICLTFPLLRILRQIWQFPVPSFLQLSLFYLVELIYRGNPNGILEYWGKLSPAMRIFCISLIYIWGTRLIQRICTVAVFLITAFAEKKQHASLSFFLIGFNIAIFPILLSLLILSSVVGAPLLPLFTLPIFFIGFPRPLRFWSYPVGRSSNSCEDSVYYEQLTPHVVFALHNLVQTGSLGVVEPGEHFLLRWEDRFIWIQVLECGFTYFYYSIKGLELQETSCHTAEASRVDAVFSVAFDSPNIPDSGNPCTNCVNPYAFHTLTPLSQINVIGYSDTKNVLTGVIDSPDTLKVVNDYFHKTLIYVIMNYIVKKSERVAMVSNSNLVSEMPSKNRPSSRNQNTLKNLPKMDKRAEHHFEGAIHHSNLDEHRNHDKISSVGSQISHNSNHSQSGRGSRLAWVDDQKLSDPLTVLPTVESRPSSWDDDEDPLDGNTRSKNRSNSRNNEDPPNTKRTKTTLPPIRSKINHYATSLEDFNEADDQLNFIPGIMFDDSSDDDSVSESVASIHKVKFYRPRRKSSAHINVRVISRAERHTPIYNSPMSAALAPSPGWFLELPYDTEVIDEVQDTFPHAWFKFLLSNFGRTFVELQQQHSANSSKSLGNSKQSGISTIKTGGEKEEQIQKMQYDEDLEESYRIIVGICHLIVLGSEVISPIPSQVHKTFNGEVPWSMALDWLLSKDDLFDLVIKSYRIGVKLALDHTLIGSITGWAELQAYMEDYTQNWYFGPDTKSADAPLASSNPNSSIDKLKEPNSWMEAVREEIPSLFSLGYNPVKGVYTSHLLSLGEAEVAVGRLGCETVRGLWASLVTELLYLTNDDDERYSIQAQPGLLRNLTIQAADPPLGYPIFSSPPLRLAVPWLSATLQKWSSDTQDDNVS